MEELRALQNKLLPLQRVIREMPADGSCLFAALRDQLALVGVTVETVRDVRVIGQSVVLTNIYTNNNSTACVM